MIDLSYLTEEEQEMIMTVLKRDSNLKKAEDQRIKKLQKTEQDKIKLKYLTGEWFYETKLHRHRDRIHGSDIIRASMRHSKPLTILELSEICPERPSFLNSESKDVFIPPELSGIIEEFPSQDKSREDQYLLAETQQGSPSPLSQIKPRQNPFNSKPSDEESPRKTDGHLTSGAGETHLATAKVHQTTENTHLVPAKQHQQPAAEPHNAPVKPGQIPAETTQTPAEELPPPTESTLPSNTNQNTDSPQPENKLLHCSTHVPVLDTGNDPVTTQDMSPTQRGILKHSGSSCSFTESLSLRNSFSSQPTTPLNPENSDSSHSPPLSPSSEWSSPGSLDRKQVRFSPIIQAKDKGRQEVQDGEEHRELDLLDQDCSPPFDQEEEPDTTESTNTSNPMQYHCVEKQTGETDSEPLISAQSSILNEGESTPPEPSVLSSEKVGEFLGGGNWSDEIDHSTCTIQTPFDHAEPRSSKVSEPNAPLVKQGKAIHLSPEGQAHMLTEEEGSSIAKVLEWFGRVSKESGKVKERSVSPEAENRSVPENPDTPDTENVPPSHEEIKAKSSPKPRKGLLALFSRTETKGENPENVLTKENVAYQDSVISDSQAPHTPPNSEADDISDVQDSISKVYVVTEEHKTSVFTSKTEDSTTLSDRPDDVTQQKESLGEKSPSRIASLKSFWERGNKGPKILSIKKSADTDQFSKFSEGENKAINQKPTEVTINPSEENSEFREDTSRRSNESPELHSGFTSHEEKASTVDIDQMPHEQQMYNLQTESKSEDLQSLPFEEKEQKDDTQNDIEDEIPSPVPLARKSLTQQDTKPAIISNLEKSGPQITISTSECVPDVSEVVSVTNVLKGNSESHMDVGPTNIISKVESPERKKSSLTREAGKIILSLKEKIERSPRKQSPSRVPVKSQVDTDRMSPSTHHGSPLKILKMVSNKGEKLSPSSSPNKNISPGCQDNDFQSADDNLMKVPTKSSTPSPRRKVPPRDLYPVKESKKNESPFRAISIDINPTEKIQGGDLEDNSVSKDLTEYPTVKEPIPTSNKKDLTEPPEQHLMIISGETSEQNVQFYQYQLMSPQSPTSQERFPGIINLGNVGEKQISPVHGSPHSQGQFPDHLNTSSEHHRKASNDSTDGRPVIPKERKQLFDLQPNIRLARSYIPLSYQHYLGLPESAHNQPDTQEWIRVEVGEGSEQVLQGRLSSESSPSRCSQREESEDITFDSSRSASPEAWSQSRTSSICDSVEPSPVRTVPKQASVRPISISKSLENLATQPSQEERWKNDPRSDLAVSVEDVSADPNTPSTSVLDPEQMKMLSTSMPAFIQQKRSGRGSDCTSVDSFYSERQRKDSTNTNLSVTSDHASVSSVGGSVMSVYFGNIEVKGTIQFAINYVHKLGEFHIFVVQCRDLAVADPKRTRSDPYVKCYLLPDKAKLGKRKTAVKKKTVNPTYNEILRYKIPLESLKSQTLNLSVWHNDTFGRNIFLGEVDVDLSEWDFNNTHMMDYALKGRIPVHSSPKRVIPDMEMSGEIRVALRFLTQTTQSKKTPQAGEVQIWVKECSNLPARGGIIDPFVKCTLLPDTARKSRQKTRVVKRTANPVFNHTMVYDGFRPEDLREVCVELTVWGHDRLSNHFIGGTRLSLGTGKSYNAVMDWMDSNSAEAGLWKRMIELQNDWVEDVIPLRMLIMARTMSK